MNHGTKLPLDQFVLVVLAGTIWAASASGQLPSPSPTASISPPPISVAPPPLLVLDACTAAVTFSSGASLQVQSTSDRFPLISAAAGETLNIAVRFPLTAVGAILIAQPLDGGTVSPDNPSLALDGTVTFQLQVGGQPGLYRLQLSAGDVITTLRFWVSNPDDPSSDPPALIRSE